MIKYIFSLFFLLNILYGNLYPHSIFIQNLAPKSHNSPSIKEDFFKNTISRFEISKGRGIKSSINEAEEIKKILKWILPLRANLLSNKVLTPSFENETYSDYIKRIKAIFLILKTSDLNLPKHINIKLNTNLINNGWTITISYKQVRFFSFTYIPKFSPELSKQPNEKLLDEFNNKPLLIVKSIWTNSEVTVNNKIYPKTIITDGNYQYRGIPVTESGKIWINPYSHLDEHLTDIFNTKHISSAIKQKFIIQPISERTHTTQKFEIDKYQTQQNLKPETNVIPSLVIGDLHSDIKGLNSILSILIDTIEITDKENFSWSNEASYKFNQLKLTQKFPTGMKIITVGDHFGRQGNEQEAYETMQTLFTLQKKLQFISNNFEIILIAGNYEIASALNFSELPEEMYDKGINYNSSKMGSLQGVYNSKIKPFFQNKSALSNFNQLIYSSIFKDKNIKAAVVADNRLILHGGLPNPTARLIIFRLLKERYPNLKRPSTAKKLNSVIEHYFIPKSRSLLKRQGQETDINKIYLEDLADYINSNFHSLLERDINNPRTINLFSFWGDIFFGFGKTIEDQGSIFHARTDHFQEKKILVPQTSGHSAYQFLNAPIASSFNGKRMIIDIELNKQNQPSCLYFDPTGYYQITYKQRQNSNIDQFYKDAITLLPDNIDENELITSQTQNGDIKIDLNQTQRSYNLNITKPLNEYYGADITAVLASLGLGIETMSVNYSKLKETNNVEYKFKIQILKLNLQAQSTDELKQILQQEITQSLKKLNTIRQKNNNKTNSRLYWELFQQGSLQISGINRSYFSRISDYNTNVLKKENFDSQTKVLYKKLINHIPSLANKSVIQLKTAERYGLLHLIFRIIEEELEFKIDHVQAKTLSENDKVFANDLLFLTKSGGKTLTTQELNQVKEKLEFILNFNIINGVDIGTPDQGFIIETIIKNPHQSYKILNLDIIKASS